MPHIRIQSLAARHTQNHRTQNQEGDGRFVDHEHHRIVRTDGPHDFWMLGDVINPQSRNGCKPHHGDGAKELADAAGAALLHSEETKQNDDGERDHILLKGG